MDAIFNICLDLGTWLFELPIFICCLGSGLLLAFICYLLSFFFNWG